MASFSSRAQDPAAGPGVRIVEWPSEAATLEQLAAVGVPRLVVVEAGAEPPIGGDCCQDWMWKSGGEGELRLRLRQLALRAFGHGQGQPYLDSLGMLHAGLRSVHVPGKEQSMIRLLLANFNRAVSRDALLQAAWPEGNHRHNTVANRISSLRARIAWLGLEIFGSAATGYVLRSTSTGTARPEPAGFEDDLDGPSSV